MSIKPLNHHYAFENPASVYDEEALTALQLAGRTTAKVNEAVNAFNELEANTEERLATQDSRIERMINETMPDEVADEFAENLNDGTFDHMIDTYAGELEARLNNLLGSVTEGSTTMDAEVIDARMTVLNGEVRASLGDAIREQMRFALMGSHTVIKPDNYTNYFTTAKDAPLNKVFTLLSSITEDMVADLPIYGYTANFFTLGYSGRSKTGIIQVYASAYEWYFRYMSGSDPNYYWGEWHRLLSSLHYGQTHHAIRISDTASIEIDNDAHTLSIKGDGVVWGGHVFQTIGGMTKKSESLEITTNGTYHFYIRDKELHRANMTEYRPHRNDIIVATLHLNAPARVYNRTWVIGDYLRENPTWLGLASIFRRVCCCGDSYTSGYISAADGTPYRTNENHAWPSHLARITGNEFINCGSSGTTVLSWQTSDRGLSKARAAGKCDAYMLGLGLNDKGSTQNVPIGTAADIGTDAQTYYGGLSKIITELRAISPKAHVFVFTMCGEDETTINYNRAIRAIVAHFNSTGLVHLLDLANYRDMFVYPFMEHSFSNNHYLATGYQQAAEIIRRVWGRYIAENVDLFQYVHLIPIEGE